MKKKKTKQKMKVTYHQVKAKNESELMEHRKRVEKMFDILFDAVLNKRKE